MQSIKILYNLQVSVKGDLHAGPRTSGAHVQRAERAVLTACKAHAHGRSSVARLGGDASRRDHGSAGSAPGTYARGTETVDAILKAAHHVLIEEGASAFTIRRIAAASGMKVGNVSYHFPRKEMLIKIMLDELLESYDKLLESEVRRPGVSPEERLRLMIRAVP